MRVNSFTAVPGSRRIDFSTTSVRDPVSSDRSMQAQAAENALAIDCLADERPRAAGAVKERDRTAAPSKDREDLTPNRSEELGLIGGLHT